MFTKLAPNARMNEQTTTTYLRVVGALVGVVGLPGIDSISSWPCLERLEHTLRHPS